LSSHKTLFIGQGTSAQCWYRCVLPAIHTENFEWIGTHYTDEPSPAYFGHLVGGSDNEYPDVNDFDVIIVQMVRGEEWRLVIDTWQSWGKKVLYEIDDFVHGIKRIADHRFKDTFHKRKVKEFELCMKQADGLITSTEFLANQYKKYNKNVSTCLVSLDTKRYNIRFAPKDFITVGWAGGTGHHKAVGPWLEIINSVMKRNPKLGFGSIGTNYASALEPYHQGRTLSMPWVPVESYPYALTNFDLIIAPAHDSKYFKSKSDLRFLEASALGIPVIASPITYGEHKDLATIVTSINDFETELEDWVYDQTELNEKAIKAKEFTQKERDISVGKQQWIDVVDSFV
jgi:glycosyltransferase involved in cell wall biosynthesis